MTDGPTVLVTGHSGLFGRAVMPALRRRGVRAIGLARRPAPGGVPADVFDALRIREVIETVRPTHILHLAWDVTPGQFFHSGSNLDWVSVTMMFARAAAQAGVSRFVGVGTCAEYDWADGGSLPRRETDPIAPDTLYGIAKDATRRLLETYFRQEGVSFAWARPFHLFGPDESPLRLVGGILAALREDRPFICRHGQLARDFIATTDLGEALARLVLSDLRGPINIASGEPTTLGDIARTLGTLAGKPHLVDVREEPSNPRSMLADVTRMRCELGVDFIAPLKDRLRELFIAALAMTAQEATH